MVSIVALRWYASSKKNDMETDSEAVLPMIVVIVCRISSDDDDDDDDISSDWVDIMMDDVVDLDNDSRGSRALLDVAFLEFKSPSHRGGGEVAAAWR